jgi:hypothetical protein
MVWASMYATLHTSFHQSTPLGSEIHLGLRVFLLASLIVAFRELRDFWAITP